MISNFDISSHAKRDPYFWVAPMYDFVTEPFIRPFKRETRRILSGAQPKASDIRILEVACGTGTQALMLAENGRRVYALDKSASMLARGAAKANRNGGAPYPINILGAAELLPFPDASFDAVVMQLTLHEMDPAQRDQAMVEMKRVTRNDAMFLIVDFVPARRFTVFKPALALAELSLGRRHWQNGREFVRKGGLVSFLARHEIKVLRTRTYFQGLIMLALGRKDGSSPYNHLITN